MIKKLSAKISQIKDVTPTAKEIHITPSEPLPFSAGAFINLFIPKNGETLRRAYSISSTDSDPNTLVITMRLNPRGAVTPLFWDDSIAWDEISIMGPLGMNTADKITARRIFLFGYGVGAGVVKSLADNLLRRPDLESLTIMTGSRTRDEMLYKDYFTSLAGQDPKIHVRFTLSRGDENDGKFFKGYIQDHIADFNFNDSAVYICGQEKAVAELVTAIKEKKPNSCTFYEEAFH